MLSPTPPRRPWYSRGRKQVILVACLGALLMSAAALCYALVPPAVRPIDYLEIETAGASERDALPLLVAIHGRGGSPAEFAEAFRKLDVPARVILPRAPDRYEAGGSWYPLDDVLRRPVVIGARTEQLADLIAEIARTRPTLGRPILTGFSQGGVMSFSLAARFPERFAAAFPIAGTQYVGMPAPRPGDPAPVFHAFHGHDDPIMPIAEARAMVASMRDAGSPTSLRDHRAVGHELTDDIRDELLAAVSRALRDARTTDARTR